MASSSLRCTPEDPGRADEALKRCVGESVTRRKQKVKRLLVEEAGGCCALCGYSRCIINLHFHHVDPAEKSFGLSMNTTKAIARYREELKKCVLVCANCHGEIEAGLIPSPPAGASFREVSADQVMSAQDLPDS